MAELGWFFKKHIPGEHIAQNINSEFFKTDHIEDIPSALVRESIQNSLDAKSESEDKVKVRFRIGTMSRKYFPSYPFFNQLSEHIHAEDSGISDLAKRAFRSNFNFIVIEDFNTNGLCGDITYAKNKMPAEENDFYFFFRNDGRSGKKSSLGKWGVGKTIFPAVSKLNTFWAVTVRETDKKEYLMGRCILGHHTIRNKGYIPFGYFGIRENSDSILVLPDDNKEIINLLKKTFDLYRENKLGLSIIIPFVGDEFNFDTVVYSCLSQYLFPIACDGLEISVSQKLKTLKINSDSLEEIIHYQIEKGKNDRYIKLSSTLNFIRYINDLSAGDYVPLHKSSINNVPRWSEKRLFDNETLQSCRYKFERGDNLNFIVPVQIQPKEGEKVWGKFKLHLERDNELTTSEDLYIREGLKIPGVSSIGGRQLRGIFIADRSPLTDFLCAAENPAHTEWQPDAEGFKDKYNNADLTLSFLKNSFAKIISILTKPLDEVDYDLLAEWFPFEVSKGSTKRRTKTKRKKGKKREIPDIPDISYVPVSLVSKSPGGFKIRRNPDYIESIEAIEIRVAYHTVKGNPLSRYHPLDFSFENGGLLIEKAGLKTLEIKNNRLFYKVLDNDFNIIVSGFDENRDIYLKVNKLKL